MYVCILGDKRTDQCIIAVEKTKKPFCNSAFSNIADYQEAANIKDDSIETKLLTEVAYRKDAHGECTEVKFSPSNDMVCMYVCMYLCEIFISYLIVKFLQ